MKPRYLAPFFKAKNIKQPQLLFTDKILLFCLIIGREQWHFVQLGKWKADCTGNGFVTPTVYY